MIIVLDGMKCVGKSTTAKIFEQMNIGGKHYGLMDIGYDYSEEIYNCCDHGGNHIFDRSWLADEIHRDIIPTDKVRLTWEQIVERCKQVATVPHVIYLIIADAFVVDQIMRHRARADKWDGLYTDKDYVHTGRNHLLKERVVSVYRRLKREIPYLNILIYDTTELLKERLEQFQIKEGAWHD